MCTSTVNTVNTFACAKPQNDDIICCNSCLLKVHSSCVKQSASLVWRCSKCRNISDKIMEIFDDVKYACKEIHDIKVNSHEVNARMTFLETKLDETFKELSGLRQANSELLQQLQNKSTIITTLSTENSLFKDEIRRVNTQNQKTPASSVNHPVLVIGDSTLRDFHSSDQSKVMIRSFSGARLCVIKDKISAFAQDRKYFSEIFIVAGTNDCSQQQLNTDTVVDDFLQVLKQADKVSNKVTFSSILPRTDNGSALLKIENMNQRIREMIVRMPNVRFIDNDKNFRLSDKSPNSAFLQHDGLHLNQQGTECLIKNLGIVATFRLRRANRTNYHQQTGNYSFTPRSQMPNALTVQPINSKPYESQVSTGAFQALQPQYPGMFPNFTSAQQPYYFQNNAQPYQQQRDYSAPQHVPRTIPPNYLQPVICHRCSYNHMTAACPIDPNI